jgi:histidinol-phosphate aminotransferase
MYGRRRLDETMTTDPQPNPGILEIAPYVAGEGAIEGVEKPIRLASNESALGASPLAIAAYRAASTAIHRYPDSGSSELREAIGRHFDLDPDRIVCGNGSEELISLLLNAYAGAGDEVLYSEYGFLLYKIGAQSVGAVPVAAPEDDFTTDVDALLASVTEQTRIVFVANPNNPTGTWISREEMARLHAGLPTGVLLVIDAAYAEFVAEADYDPGIELVEAADNVVMLRTFSKMYGLAGLRVGWLYASAGVVDILNRIRRPFGVNLAAQAAAVAALADKDLVARVLEHNTTWRSWFESELAGLGLDFVPSIGNFVLVKFPPRPRHAAAAYAFLRKRGILTRPVGGYGLPDWLRITIGKEEEMLMVANGIEDFLGGGEAQ